MIDRSTNIQAALRSRQRGFLLNPFRFGPVTPPTDPYWSSVISLLSYESDFTDSKSGTWTASGSAAAGVSAGLYGNSGSFLTATSNIKRNLTLSGAFTIETTFKLSSISSLQSVFRFGDDPANTLAAYVNGSGKLQIYTQSAFSHTSSFTLSSGVKYHLAASYAGSGDVLFFFDGVYFAFVSAASFLGTRDFYWGGDSYSQGLIGYLDESRITTAGRYSSDFTPPSGPYPTS